MATAGCMLDIASIEWGDHNINLRCERDIVCIGGGGDDRELIVHAIVVILEQLVSLSFACGSYNPCLCMC